MSEKKDDDKEQPEAFAVEMSPQARMFLEGLPDEDKKILLDMIEKIAQGAARGEVVGEIVKDEDLPDDVRDYVDNYHPSTKKNEPS